MNILKLVCEQTTNPSHTSTLFIGSLFVGFHHISLFLCYKKAVAPHKIACLIICYLLKVATQKVCKGNLYFYFLFKNWSVVLMKIPLLSTLDRGSIARPVEEFGKLTFWSPVAIMAEMLGVFLNIYHFKIFFLGLLLLHLFMMGQCRDVTCIFLASVNNFIAVEKRRDQKARDCHIRKKYY